MRRWILCTSLLFLALAARGQDPVPSAEEAQSTYADLVTMIRERTQAQAGPHRGALGTWAHVEVPQGLDFAGAEGTREYLRMTGNIPSEASLGSVMQLREQDGWFVIFSFDPAGYVKDDEKDELDPEDLLDSLREGVDASNEYRRSNGLDELEITGWEREPFYDPKTNNLTWALRIKTKGGEGESVNWEVRLLGRSGVMSAQLVVDPQSLAACLPEFDALLEGFSYDSGHTYGEYREGDKIAEYGLGALVVGGGAFAAAKLGLFGKLWAYIGKLGKLVWVALAGIAFGIKRLFDSIFKSKREGRGFNER